LTVTENGYGKRSSAYEYRRTNRGGQGITNIDTSERNGQVVASFPAKQGEQLMLVTDQGKMIRTSVADIRIAGRNTQGVTIFRVADEEHVVSVAKIEEELDSGEEEIAPVPDAVIGEDLASGEEE
jgi:DNA gyrase subunit A